MKTTDQLKQTKIFLIVLSVIGAVLLIGVISIIGDLRQTNKQISVITNRLSLLDEQVGVWYIPGHKLIIEPAYEKRTTRPNTEFFWSVPGEDLKSKKAKK